MVRREETITLRGPNPWSEAFGQDTKPAKDKPQCLSCNLRKQAHPCLLLEAVLHTLQLLWFWMLSFYFWSLGQITGAFGMRAVGYPTGAGTGASFSNASVRMVPQGHDRLAVCK